MKRKPLELLFLLQLLFCLCIYQFAGAQSTGSKRAVAAVLKQVTTLYGTQFVYDPVLLEHKQTSYQLKGKDKPIEEVLKAILYPDNLLFLYVKPNYYTIVSKDRIRDLNEQHAATQLKKESEGTTPVGLIIKGQVTDEQGNPLAHATIRILNTDSSTQTNTDGTFSIGCKTERPTIRVSFTGYNDQEVPVDKGNFITIKLQPKSNALEQVVVVGYGTQRKEDVTGSVASADLKDFRNAPNTNMAQLLQGTVPGLNVGQVTNAGGTPSISIRGNNTISGNSSVLIILDGIQYHGSLESINPDDIASVDVLKDASATAVYGAQAANGVLLITTRKGQRGQPRFSLSSSYSTQTPTNDLRPMKRDDYLDHVRQLNYDEAYLAPAYTQPNPDFNLSSELDPTMLDAEGNIVPTDFDWWDAGTNPGYINDNQLSISGGTEKVTYLFSGGYTKQSGFIINDKFERKSLRINLEMKATDWWKIGAQTFGSFVNRDGAEPKLSAIMQQSPLIEPYDENGKLKPYPFNTNYANPFLTYDVDDYQRENYFFANLYSDIDFPFIKGLNYRINFGNNYQISQHDQASVYGAGLSGSASKDFQSYYDYTFDNILTYKHEFGFSDVTMTLLYGASEHKQDYTLSNATGFSRLTLGYNSLEQGTNQFANSDAWREALDYQMARLNYKYKDKYLLTATIRRDGFSGFAANHKFAYFPSAAFGWVVTKESFFKPAWVDFLKLRAGYGSSGNQTARYSSLSKISSDAAYVFGDGGSTQFGQQVESLPNPDLSWERTTGLNAGLDFRLLKGRLAGSLDYYDTYTHDLLFSVDIPTITGFSTINSNVGEIENQGFELSLTSYNVDGKNFKWSSTVNFSRNVNKILKLTGLDGDGDGKEDDLVASGLFIGHSINTAFAYVTNGIYQIGDDIPAGYYPGTYRIVDEDHDGKITPDDRRILGSNDPAYRISLLNSFEYKRFTLTVFLNSIQGGAHSYLGGNTTSIVRDDNAIRNNHIEGIDYWSPLNPGGKYPSSLVAPTISPSVFYPRSFVRLQDVSVSYRFSGAWVKKLHLQNLNMYLSGKNLFTWTKWEGWDPETNQGLENDGRPVMKAYSLGVNITF